MDYTTHVIAHQYPLSEDTFETKLKEVSEQICNNGYSQSTLFNNLTNVIEAVVSTNYIAFLLEDGRVCRISYNLIADKLLEPSSNDLSKNKAKIQNTQLGPSSTSSSTSTSAAVAAAVASAAALSGTTTASAASISAQLINRPQSRAGFRSHETFIIPAAQEMIGPLSTSHAASFSRNRRGQLLRGRVPGLIMGSRIPSMLPASAVPEALIESVQTVLQSKSRNVIIRELQRTNLDVNLAVNNLLQRDDEGDDGGEDDDPYIHGGDDLISLLDINSSHGEHSVIIDSDGSVFDEDTFRISRRLGRSIAASNAAATAAAAELNPTERDRKSYRLRDQRWYETAYRDEIFHANRLERENAMIASSTSKPDDLSSSSASTQKKSQQQQQNSNPVSFGDNLQFMTNESPFFIKIASLYSELVAVTKSGQLYQWKWSSDSAYVCLENQNVHHPKTLFLNLLNEKVSGIATSSMRASIWTESGKVASWLDETVDISYTVKLQTPAFNLYDPLVDSIQQLSVSNLFSVAKLQSGTMYWWGVMPYEHRCKQIEKYQSKAHKLKNSQTSEITVGSYVSLKTFPLYNSGTIAITIKDGQPKIGQIMEHLFSFKDSKLFKFKLKSPENFKDGGDKEMPPPASLPTILSLESIGSGGSSIGGQYSLKRKKPSSDYEDKSSSRFQKDEESWQLSETIFVEDTKQFLLGKVIKIDNDHAIVKMQSKVIDTPLPPQPLAPGESPMETQSLLDNCRILAKSQLQAVKLASSFKLPDFIQKIPKKLSDIGNVITFVAQQNGIHALISKEGSIYYIFYDIITNKILKEKKMPTRTKAMLGATQIRLNTIDDPNFNLITMIDGNSTFYPLIDIPGSNMIKDPSWKNLFPIKYFSQVIIPPASSSSKQNESNKKNIFLTLFSMRIENLIANILRGDLDRVNSLLKQLDGDYRANTEIFNEKIKKILNERLDGNRNIIHSAVYACAPTSNKDIVVAVEPPPSSNSAQIKSTFERSWSSNNKPAAAPPPTSAAGGGDTTTIEINSTINDHSYENHRLMETDASSYHWTHQNIDSSSSIVVDSTKQQAKETLVWPMVKIEDKERRLNSIKILQALLDSPALKDSLNELLSFKNAEGATPFMYAINIRAYNAALCLLDTALAIRTETPSNFYKIIYPQNSSADNCPLYVLCCNDTCSFTWTGDNHITQDIFECKTCTLVGNLCCCTECARTCHKGHDCKIKTSSPTAYCDCWEKCKCKSLIAGDQDKRFELLCKLLTETNLLMYANSRGEHLLLFLVQVVGRQIQEQRNYKRGNTVLRKNLQQPIDADMPQHDLEPPKFSRRALERILNDWQAVKEMILFNYKCRPLLKQQTGGESSSFDEMSYYDNQNGSIDLDKFIHCLIVKCPQEMLNTLVQSMTKETTTNEETNVVIRRFLRSVARLFVLLTMESIPSPSNSLFNQTTTTNLLNNNLKYRKTTTSATSTSGTTGTGTTPSSSSSLLSSTPLGKCEHIFRQFSKLSIEELISTAQSLITPVLLGIVKPSMFRPLTQEDRTDRNYNNNNNLVDELLNVEASSIQRHSYVPQSRTESIPPPPPPAPSFSSSQRRSQFPISSAIRRGILQPSDILNATSAASSSSVVVQQPPPPPPPSSSSSISVVVPPSGGGGGGSIGGDGDTYSDQISENDDSESNTRDNYELHEEMELNLFAESDSDSDNSNGGDSNRDNASAAQRSAITAATVGTGSDPGGVYFSDNDSDVSSNEEDEDSSDIRSDILNVDNDNSELLQFASEQQQTNDLYNRQIQWSVRRNITAAAAASGGDAVTTTSSSRLPTTTTISNYVPHSVSLMAPTTTSGTTVTTTSSSFTTTTTNPSLYQDIHMRRATHAVPLNTITSSSSQSAATTTTTPIQVQSSSLNPMHHHYSSHSTADTHHHNQHHHSHHHNHNQNTNSNNNSHESETVSSTNNTLARSFSVIMRQIRELLNTIYQKDDKLFDIQAFNYLIEFVNNKLEPTWQWIVNILDTTESQLRFGCASNSLNIVESSVAQYLKGIEDKAISSNTKHNDGSNNRRRTLSTFSGIHRTTNTSSSATTASSAAASAGVQQPVLADQNNPRRDFMNYALSIMRMGSNEHKEMLPYIDLYNLKHVAYIFDGLMCYLRITDLNNEDDEIITKTTNDNPSTGLLTNRPLINMSSLYETDEIESETEMETCVSYQTDSASEEDESSKSAAAAVVNAPNTCARSNTFFKRSDSTLCLGGSSPDPFSLQLDESLILAAKPHLLHPNSRKQDLFKNETNQVEQFNLFNRLNERKITKPLVLPSFKKLTSSFNQTSKLIATNELNKVIIENSYGASNCLRAIVQNLQKAQQKNDESSTTATTVGTTAADLLDLSLNKVISGATSPRSSTSTSSAQQKNETTIFISTTNQPTNEFFDRWRVTLDVFGRVYCDDVGLENGSIIRQLGGFQIKETRFRREMEKYRNMANKELSIEVERDRDLLMQSTFRALNNLYSRRPTSSNSLPPLCLSRVRITFKDEQGEGSGVARSFYTAFCEAVLADEKLPSLENVYSHTSNIYSPINSSLPLNMLQRYRNSREYRRRQRSKSRDTNERQQLCKEASSFYVPGPSAPTNADFTLYDSLSVSYKEIGERLFTKVVLLQPANAPKITGMLLDLKIQQLTVLLSSESFLRAKVEEAVNLLASSGESTTNPQQQQQVNQEQVVNYLANDDNTPLFWQADKKGFFSPRPGKNSTSRLNAFRNIGRIIGICLLQNELCPLPLARHVIKYILNRPIKWHDFAFFDSAMFESFRKMIHDTEKNGESICKSLDLTFNVDLSKDEDGGNFDLIQNGGNIEVNKTNMYEFVKRYAEYRMVKHVEKCCEQLKLGVYDVLPTNSLNDLNAEDFRLLLNGIPDINIQTLMSYTTFSDESKESSRRSQFEKWFWNTVEKMSNQEKQELLFFWTGSPYLPASEDGFQPLPSITLRPQSDLHLPTANTCINRLYIPLYSSKSILKSKLLFAIKTKLFGFV